MVFNENARVKIPALIHLTRLGYQYFSLKDHHLEFHGETNIIKNIFKEQFLKLNGMNADSQDDASTFEKEFQNISLELGQDDLGRSFYHRLIGTGNSKYKLIDWENFKHNTFHICTELTYKNGEDEFRPDITVFVNGLPLAFIEVKKPNNPEGIKAERDRINDRFQNYKFRKFINITQLLVFSNNMSYDDIGQDQLQGAFYATTTRNPNVKFNNFREEVRNELPELADFNDETEHIILEDNNAIVIKHSPEFLTNREEKTPTNSILSSLFSKERLKTLLQFGIVYVDEVNGQGEPMLQKHIMRYPQFFAAKAIRKTIDEGVKKGVIWHTQGSGKTALAFYCYRYLTEYYSKKGIVPKFYFIVDRLDLLKQASKEFKKRGLPVRTVQSKDELVADFQQNTTSEGFTVINIQKFNEDTTAFNDSGYNIHVQRIYFIDEAHRSYDPKGSSLANLYNSDQHSIKIALTGTPLILYKEHQKADENDEHLSNKADLKTTKNIFGNYIHKYYYNNSIKDGYTLKLLREEIETSYKEKMQQVVRNVENELKVKLGTLEKKELKAHPKFVEPMLAYIVNDFINSRIRFGDETIGAMVVCDSSEQAREMFRQCNDTFGVGTGKSPFLHSALILHNENDKDIRNQQINDFKDGKIDFLFVYSMLLTGFDAPRLKKLYLGRKIRAHNLLQTLTRVNRPYKEFRIGYVVDFADISQEFDATNKAYFDELNREYDTAATGENENDVFGSLFMSQEEIDTALRTSGTVLADYSTDNKELFSQQITALQKEKLIKIKKSLEQMRELYNIARLLGHMEAVENIDFKLISQLLTEVSNRLQLLNLQEAITDVSSKELLNTAIENVVFNFTKIGEEELKMLANDLQEKAYKIRTTMKEIGEQKDPEWISLYEEFRNLLEKHHINETNFTRERTEFVSKELENLWKRVAELNRIYRTLRDTFDGDKKFARIYKTYEASGLPSNNIWLFDILKQAKQQIDGYLGQNENMLDNQGYFKQLVAQQMLSTFENNSKNADFTIVSNLSDLTSREYLEEYQSA
ncbi:MAG: DEAD/DEAH box helicase family protein [Candidatus Peribacteria bacterium]|jgi:type I restriction enzyme R subunit|nr:DEAD/DEAH box helicase family protein [Candidatus Peribacteria bacterium]